MAASVKCVGSATDSSLDLSVNLNSCFKINPSLEDLETWKNLGTDEFRTQPLG